MPPQAVMVQESFKMALGTFEWNELGLGEFLATKKPELILPTTTPVLTSYQPVCRWSPGDDAPVGYKTAHVVWVPLAPNLIVQFREPDFDLTAHDLPDQRDRANHDALALFMNRVVADQAERWITHHPDPRTARGSDPSAG